MRRIYESRALHRDDGEPFTPRERDNAVIPQAMRAVNSTALSQRIVPDVLCHRVISVGVSTPQPAYSAETPVPFTVTMTNTMPVPITVTTNSPIRWTWNVDGATEASHVSLHNPPDERRTFTFDRGERKQFRKQWHQRFRISATEWKSAEPGTYTIGAGLNVDDPTAKGLYDETTVRILPRDSR